MVNTKYLAGTLIVSLYLLLSFPSPAHANMIFPIAVTVAGLTVFSFMHLGIPMILIEALVLSKSIKVKFKEALMASFLINTLTSVLGGAYIGVILYFFNQQLYKLFFNRDSTFVINYIIMFFGTVIIETLLAKLKYKDVSVQKLLLIFAIGNILTYTFLTITVFTSPPPSYDLR